MKKRGLSPVIATVLLVVIALILAVIIFLWARSFVGESIEKQGREIALSCEDVAFRAEAYGGNLHIVNQGGVPIYGVEIRTREVLGRITQAEPFSDVGTIESGQTAEVALPSGVSEGEDIIVIPMLLGETDEYKKQYTCDEDYGVDAIVEA